MEARLLQARKLPNQYGVEEWQLIDPERRGIEVTRANLHKDTNLMSIDPDAMSFFINLAGDGGPWAGWYTFPCD